MIKERKPIRRMARRPLLAILLTASIVVIVLANLPMEKIGVARVEDSIWSWWSRPLAIQVNSNTYFTGVDSKGNVRAYKRNNNGVVESYIDKLEADDHNAPSIIAKEGKPTLVFYTEHYKNNIVSHKQTINQSFIFGEKREIKFEEKVTYSQIMEHNNKLVLLTRLGLCKWSYAISDDWSKSWSNPKVIIDACDHGGHFYMLTSKTKNGKYSFAAYGHPSLSNWREVGYGEINLNNGSVTSGGEEIYNLYADRFNAIRPEQMETVWRPSSNSERVRLLDIGQIDDKVLVFYAKWDDVEPTPMYKYSIKDADAEAWSSSEFGLATGEAYGHSGANYVGGVSISQSNNQIIISYRENKIYKLDEYYLNSEDELMREGNIAKSKKPLIRPIHTIGHNSYMVQEVFKYDSFTEYYSDAIIFE